MHPWGGTDSEDAESACDAVAVEGRCFMIETKFQTPAGTLVEAADLSIGDSILDHKHNLRTVTWCRKLPKQKRELVDLYTKPLTVTSSHRVVVPGGEVVQAKDLKKNDEVLMGNGCQQLLKVSMRAKWTEVMELEFAEDAIVEVHTPSILTKGSDPSVPIDQHGRAKCKEEKEDDDPMDGVVLGCGRASSSQNQDADHWPDTDDSLR